MNIFVLDESPRIAASYHADIHLGKMILESAQMMSCHAANAVYKPTHQKHPCTVWVGESLDNWQWLKELCLWLDIERRKTGKQPHKSWEYIKGLSPSSALRPIGLTPFALAMPDDIKHDSSKSAVQKYQHYYKSKRNDMKLEYLCRPVPIFLL